MNENSSEVQAMLNFAEKHQHPEIVKMSGMGIVQDFDVIITPGAEGGKPHIATTKSLIDSFRTAPERVEGVTRAESLASLHDLTNRHKDDHSVVFWTLQPGAATFTTIIDYHKPRSDEEDMARFCRHRIAYVAKISVELQKWLEKSADPLTQRELAEWLEEWVEYLASPDQADSVLVAWQEKTGIKLADVSALITLSRGLEVRATQDITNAQRLESGETTFAFAETHKNSSGQPLRVPGAFIIRIPLFDGDPAVRILVRLRYTISGGKISWKLVMTDVQMLIRQAAQEMVTATEEFTRLPVYRGSHP